MDSGNALYGKEWNRSLGEPEDRIIRGIPIGRYSYFPWDDNTLSMFVRKIGRFTSINEKAIIHRNHPVNMLSSSMGLFDILEGVDRIRYEKMYVKNAHGRNPGHKVSIGNDVWIGANAFIDASTVSQIGDGAVIGANAVVTKNVPPYAVIVGANRILRYRFQANEIEKLLDIRWWDWDDDKIRENQDVFINPRLLFDE